MWRNPRIPVLILALLAAGCDVTARQEVHRCLEEVSLQELLETAEVARQPQAWGIVQEETMTENRLFDGNQEAMLRPENPGPDISSLCGRLKEQLASRCDVREFRAGGEYCAAAVESPVNSTTGPAGVLVRRPTHGRVLLSSSRMPDGQSKVVLITTEWAH